MYVAHICALHFISSDRYPKKKKGLYACKDINYHMAYDAGILL